MSLETAQSIKNSNLCRYDTLDGFLSFFNKNGEIDGWDIYNNICMYNSWNGVLFGNTKENYCYLGRTSSFDYIACEVYYIVSITMKVVPQETSQGALTKGRIQWITIEDNLWDTDRQYDFDIIDDGKWHVYNMNMGPHKYWIGHVNNLRIYPFIDGWKSDFFAIEKIGISSVETWACLNHSCSYYQEGNYIHPCPGSGKKGSCLAGQSKSSYNLVSNSNDELIVDIDGYGEEKFDLGNCSEFNGYEIARRLSKHISGLSVGGYTYCEVEVDEYDRDKIKITSGSFGGDSAVHIADSPAARELGFYDDTGNDISIKESGIEPASGFDFLSTRLLTGFEITKLIDGTIDSSSYLHSPYAYNVEGGRSDYSSISNYSLTKDFTGGISFNHSMSNAYKTIIDISNPINSNGKIKSIYVVGKAYNNLDTSKVMLFRPYRDGQLEVINSFDLLIETTGTVEVYKVDCDILVRRGDVFGVYNTELCVPFSFNGHPDAVFYHVTFEPSGKFDPGYLYNGGSSGFPIYIRSSRKKSSVILDIDLGKRVNVEKMVVHGSKNQRFEYNISSCKDLSWDIDTHGLTHNHNHKNGSVAHTNLVFGEEALNDNITTPEDPYTGLTFGVGSNGYWTSGTHVFCYVNGDDFFDDPGVGSVDGDYRSSWLTYTILFPDEFPCNIYRSRLYFKQPSNFTRFELSYYLGAGTARGNLSSGDTTYKKIKYTDVKIDGETITDYIDDRRSMGFYENPSSNIYTYSWRVLEHNFNSVSAKGFRIDCTEHESTELTEIEVYSWFNEDTSLVDVVNVSYSSYNEVWHYSDFEYDPYNTIDVVYSDLANSPRYISLEFDSRTVFNINFISLIVGTQVKLVDCDDDLLLNNAKTDIVNDSTPMLLENVYDLPFDLSVDIPKQTLDTDTVLLWNKLGSHTDLDDSKVGPGCVLHKNEDFKFLDDSSLCMKENVCYGLKNLIEGKTAYRRSNEDGWVEWDTTLRQGINVGYGSIADRIRNDLTFDNAFYKFYKIYAYDTSPASDASIINAVGSYFGDGELSINTVRIQVANIFDDELRFDTYTETDRGIASVPIVYDSFTTGSGTKRLSGDGSLFPLAVDWDFVGVNKIVFDKPLNSFELRIKGSFKANSGVLFYDDKDNILVAILPYAYVSGSAGYPVVITTDSVQIINWCTKDYIKCSMADALITVKRTMGYFGLSSGDKEIYEVSSDTAPKGLPNASTDSFTRRSFNAMGVVSASVELDAIPGLGPDELLTIGFSEPVGVDEIRLYTRVLDNLKYGVYASNHGNDYTCLGTSDYISSNLSEVAMLSVTNDTIAKVYTREMGNKPENVFLPWVSASSSGSTQYYRYYNDNYIFYPLPVQPGSPFCCDEYHSERFWVSDEYYPHWLKYDFGYGHKRKIEQVKIIFGQKSEAYSYRSFLKGFYTHPGGCPAELYIQGSNTGEDAEVFSLDVTDTSYNHYSNTGWPSDNVSDNDVDTYIQNFTYIAIDLGAGNEKTVVRLRLRILNSTALTTIRTGRFYGSNNSTNGVDGDWLELIDLSLLPIPSTYPDWTHINVVTNLDSYRWYKILGTPANNNSVLNEWEMFEALVADDGEEAGWHTLLHVTDLDITPSNVSFAGILKGDNIYYFVPVVNTYDFDNENYYRFYRLYMTYEQVDSEFWVSVYRVEMREKFPGPGSLFDAAYDKPTEASSSILGHYPTRANDANISTYWSSTSGTGFVEQYFFVDLTDTMSIKQISVATGDYSYAYSLVGSIGTVPHSNNKWSRTDTTHNITDVLQQTTATFTENDCTVYSKETNWHSARAIHGRIGGKWYWEIDYLQGPGRIILGIRTVADKLSSFINPGVSINGWGYYTYDGKIYNNNTGFDYPIEDGELRTMPIGVAIDLDAGKIWFRLSDTWNGDPVNGTAPAFDNIPIGSIIHPAVSTWNANASWTAGYAANFGASAFVYEVPAGFNPIDELGWSIILNEPLGTHLPTIHDNLEDVEHRHIAFVASATTHPTNAVELREFNVVPYGVNLESTPYNDYFAVDLGKRYALSMVRNYGLDSFTVGIDEENTSFSSTDTNDVNEVIWSEEQAFIDNFNDEVYYNDWEVEESLGGILIERDDKIDVYDYGIAYTDGTTISGVKSVIIDFADNHTPTDTYMACRSVEFKLNGVLLELTAADFSAYATSTYSAGYYPKFLFDTTLNKIGGGVYNCWHTSINNATNVRVIIVFNEFTNFDEIVVNNYHESGALTYRAVKTAKIHITPVSYNSIIYDAYVPNSKLIFNGVIDEHVAANVVDDQVLSLFPFNTVFYDSGPVLYGPSMTYTLDELAQNFDLDLIYSCANNDTLSYAGSYTVDFMSGDASIVKLRVVNPINGEVNNVFTEYLYDSSEPTSTIRVERWGENSNDHYRGLGLVDDRHISYYTQYNGNQRYTNFTGIKVGGYYQACMKFDLTGIEGVEILEAKLHMRVKTTNGFTGPGDYKDINLYRCYKPWISTDISWYYYSKYQADNLRWDGILPASDEGVDDGSYARAETAFVTQRVYQLEYETWFDWDVTDMVIQWASGEIKNYGFVVGDAGGTWVDFYDSFDTVDGYKPYLEIKYKSNGLVYVGTGKVASLGTNTIALQRKSATKQLTYKMNNELRYLGDISTDYFNKVRITYECYNTEAHYQQKPDNHYTSYFNLLALTEAFDTRWIRFTLQFNGLTTQYINRLGVYPDISVNMAPGGGRNCEWVDLGEAGKLLTSAYLPSKTNFALDSDVTTNYVVGSCLPENVVDGDVGGSQNSGWAFDILDDGTAPYIEIDFGKTIEFNSVVIHNGLNPHDRRYDNFPFMTQCKPSAYTGAYGNFKSNNQLPKISVWDTSPIQFQITTTVSGDDDWFTPWMYGNAIRTSKGEIVAYYPNGISTESGRLTYTFLDEGRYDQLHFTFSPVNARRLRVTFMNWESPVTSFFNEDTSQWDSFYGSFIRELEVFSSTFSEGEIYPELWPILAFDLRYSFRIVNTNYALGGARGYTPSFKYSGENYSDPHKVSFTSEDATQLYSSTDSSEILTYLDAIGNLQNTHYSFDSDLFLAKGMYALTFELYNMESIDQMCMVLNGNVYNRIHPTVSGTISGTGTWLPFEETIYIEEDGYFEVAGEATISGTGDETYNDEWGIRYPTIIKTTSLRKRWLAIEANQEAVGSLYLRWIKAYADQSFVLTEYSLWWQSLVSELGDSINTKVGNTSLKISYPASTKVDNIKYYGEGIGQDLDWHIKDSLCFWLYIDNISKLDLDSLQISTGKTKYVSEDDDAVTAYYVWKVNDIMTLKTGWNRVKLPFDDYHTYVPYMYQSGPKSFLDPELNFAFNGSPFSLFQMDFSGVGQEFNMYLDDIGIERNIFDDDVKFGKGLCLVNFESLEIPLANANLGKGTVEFWFKAYSTAQGTDLFSSSYSKHLFTMTSSSDMISLGILAGYGLQITISEDTYKVNKHIIEIDNTSSSYFMFNDVVHFALIWDNTGTFIGGSRDTVRLYMDNKLVYNSTDTWTVSDPKPNVIKLGGSPKSNCYTDSESLGSGIFENIKIYNYCRTDFDSTEEEDVKNIYSANDFVEISPDNINFYGSDSGELPLVFEDVPVSGTRTVYVRSSKNSNFVKSRDLTAGLYVEWEVSI